MTVSGLPPERNLAHPSSGEAASPASTRRGPAEQHVHRQSSQQGHVGAFRPQRSSRPPGSHHHGHAPATVLHPESNDPDAFTLTGKPVTARAESAIRYCLAAQSKISSLSVPTRGTIALPGASPIPGPLPKTGTALRSHQQSTWSQVPAPSGAATQMPLAGKRYSVLNSKHSSYLGAPLRNRTVDLLLTMYLRPVPLSQGRAPEQPKHEHRPAAASPRRLSRASFATRSATHFDLGRVAGGRRRRCSCGRPQPDGRGPARKDFS